MENPAETKNSRVSIKILLIYECNEWKTSMRRRLNQLIIDKDTLKNLDFTMRTMENGKTRIYFNGMQVSDDISTMKLENKFRKYYKRILFKELKSKLK